MKNLIYFSIIILLFSCQANQETKSELDFSFTLDTVKVNSNNLLLNVDGGMSTLTLSPDNQFLYFFNPSEKRLDQIDLENYEIFRSITFSKDGPNSIGSLSPYEFEILETGEIIIASFDAIRKMDAAGNKIENYNWDAMDFLSGSIPHGYILSFAGEYNSNGDTFYGIYGDQRGGNGRGNGIGILEIPNRSIQTREVPLLKSLQDYEVILEGDMKFSSGDQYFLQKVDDKILISTETQNSLVVYNIQKDSLYQIDFSSQLLPNKKPGNYERKVNTMEQMQEALITKAKEISFGPWIWDEKSRKFYQFSYFQNAFDPPGYQVYLSIIDQDFELIFEMTDVPKFSGKVFFHKGVLHKALNQNDELFFVRMKPHFN